MSPTTPSKSGDVNSDEFPAGLRVLLVDDDATCLVILEKRLKKCLYEVTKCSRAEVALKLLADKKDGFDIVISDVYMPDMDGFQLLQRIGLYMDLPVIMMSTDERKEVVMKGVSHGACDYLIKPVSMESLKTIWQHVVRRKKHEWKDKDVEQYGERRQKPEDTDHHSSANEENCLSSKRRKEDGDELEERDDDASMLKKRRFVWSRDIHHQFVSAIRQLGVDKAVPKKILELMNVEGLTRENVASHLQKYRQCLKKLFEQRQNGFGTSFEVPQNPTFGPIFSLSGLNRQALAASDQLRPKSLTTIQAGACSRASSIGSSISVPQIVDENFSFGNPNLRYLEGQLQHNNGGRQLVNMHQSRQLFGNMGVHSSNLPSSLYRPALSQAIPSAVFRQNEVNNTCAPMYASLSQPSTSVDFSRSPQTELPGNSSHSVVKNLGIWNPLSEVVSGQEFNSEMKGHGGLFPNYEVCNEVNQNRTHWGLQGVGATFVNPQPPNPSVSVQSKVSSNQKSEDKRVPHLNNTSFATDGLGDTTNLSQQLNISPTCNSFGPNTENSPSVGLQDNFITQQDGQEDLLSALLEQCPDEYNLDNLLA